MQPTWRHLVRRFFSTGTARRLSQAEMDVLASWLSDPRWLAIFGAQSLRDQRHGFDCGKAVAERRPERLDLVQAAALHDVGKRHAGLGILRRTMAAGALKLGLPLPGKYALYTAHGSLGADELAAVDAPEPVVSFTRDHHGACPDGFPIEEWQLLVRADDEK